MITVKNGLVDLHAGDIPDGNWLTVREFAKRYDIPENTLRVWVQRNNVDNMTIMRQIFIREQTPIRVHSRAGRPKMEDKNVL